MKPETSNPTDMLAALAGDKRRPGRGADTPSGCRARLPVLRDDLQMRIVRDGTWLYRGSPIARRPLVKLFASVLRRENDGDYWLVTPAERGRIDVEDAPFIAVEVTAEGRGRQRRLTFRTNLDEEAVAGEAHPIRCASDPVSQAPIPYILVRDGLEARILRPVFYHLVELGEQQGDQFGVWSSGRFFPLGRLDPDL
jgi:uncharacterized protein